MANQWQRDNDAYAPERCIHYQPPNVSEEAQEAARPKRKRVQKLYTPWGRHKVELWQDDVKRLEKK
jgi:hypothetical protein